MPTPTPQKTDDRERVLSTLEALVEKQALKRIVFSKPQEKDDVRAVLMPVILKGKLHFQLARQKKDGKVHHRNISVGDIRAFGEGMLSAFRQWNLFTEAGEGQVMVSSKGQVKAVGNWQKLSEEAAPVEAQSHNRVKHRLIPEGEPVPFLVRLGIADQNGRIYDKKQDKFRQINRFLECLDDLSAYFPKDQPVRAVDFGCGKSYLTFAMHYYFTVHKGLETDIIGLDLKEDVTSFCSRTVEELGLKGIHFLKGDISQFAPIKDADLTVSLHACDTATDAALAQAIASRSRLILSVPCCHHELARQIECPPLEGITRFGVLNHRLADIATDALRAAHLEAAGYQVQVFEFIEAEHTPKNLMMRAVLKNPAGNKEAYKKYCELRDFFRVSPAIERLARLPEGIQPVQ